MNDDLDDEIIGSEDSFDEFSQKSSVSDSVRQSPVAKIALVIAGVGLVGGAMYLFGGTDQKQTISQVTGAPDISGAPATADGVSQDYRDAIEQQNAEELEKALNEGGSAIPEPTDTATPRLELPVEQQETEDPLLRWRMLQEERVERQMTAKETQVEPVTVLDAEQQSEAITKLSESMMEQMSSILDASNSDRTFETRTLITYVDENGEGTGNGASSGDAGGSNDLADGFEDETEETVVIPAGKIVYGQLLLEANSDVPSMVLAQMLSGPLKGWKLLGSFETLDDLEKLSISFSTAVNEDGKQYAVEALMLDPDTSLAAMSTDVNHRYIRRIVLPAAAAFIEGFSSAIAESGRTSVTVTGEVVAEETEETTNDQEVATGVEEAAEEIGDILDEAADVPIQIIIEAGTPMGIFFTENVVDTETDF